MRSKLEMRMKFKHFLERSRKLLHKAKDRYMNAEEYAANKMCYAGGMGYPTVHVTSMPRSFSVSYSRVSDDEFKDALQKTIKTGLGSKHDVFHRRWQKEKGEDPFMEPNVVTRSYSVCLGGLGRIDENQPCYFEEVPAYPRTTSYAVKRNFT